MIDKTKTIMNKLSPHLFWDVDREKIGLDRSMRYIINRVLEYGLIEDWVIIYKHYGIDQIADIAMQLNDLDDKTLAFIAMLSKKPLEQFRCYTTKQSKPKHWNF